MIYNKLVRDRIPEIIEGQGGKADIRILEPEEYTHYLEQKLDEEVGEYHKERNLEELADILEVVYALAENLGATKDALLEIYQSKHDSRGGFSKKIFLISKEG